jgi:hypothetical protein
MLNRALQDRGIMNVSDLGENHIRSFIGAFGEVGDVLINPRLSLNGLDYVCWAMAKGIFLPDKVAENLDRAGITKEELKSTTIWVEGKQDQPGILRKLVGIVGEVASNKTIATVHNEVRENGGYGIRLVVRDLTPAEELALERMLSGEDERGFSQGFFSDYRVFRGTKVVIEEPGELGSESYVG